MQLLQKSTYSQSQNIDADPTKHLEQSTAEYLHASFLLWEYKNHYSKKEYRELLQDYCWDKGSSEEKRALKLAEHFEDFAYRPQALTQIPVTTLLKLCSDKYKPIIEELKQFDEEDITCECVLKLIKDKATQLKKDKESQLPEKPSIWKRNCRQERYVAFPPLYEHDHQTGVLTQKLMDKYGFIPQDILRQAIADFYKKITEGQHEGNAAYDVDESRENSCDYNYSQSVTVVNKAVTVGDVETVRDLETVENIETVNQLVDDVAAVDEVVTVDEAVTVNQTVEDKWLELNQLLTADINSIDKISEEAGELIVENCQQWEAAVPASKKWSAIANITARDSQLLKYLSNYAYGNHSKWRRSWGAILASYHNFEEEYQWVDIVVKIDALIAMEYKPTAIVEVKTGEYEGMRGEVGELCSRQDKPILVRFGQNEESFHWDELEVVTEAEVFEYYTTVSELADEEYLQEPEESDIELEPTLLEKAINTLIEGSWEEIRDLFNQNPEIKNNAWEGLSATQKKRVIDITPDVTKLLNKAKKEGVIQEFKEVAAGVYQIKLPGTILWEQRAFHEIEIHYYLKGWREAIAKNN